MLVADRAERLEERRGGRVVAALAADRLDQDRRDLRRRDHRREQGPEDLDGGVGCPLLVAVELRVGGRVRREVDARQERLVAGPVVQVGGRDARRAERPAVEAAAERDDPRPAGDAAGELQRAVDRLRARVQEHHAVDRVGQGVREHRRQPHHRLGIAHRAGRADQPVDLGVDRRRHRGVMMAERRDRDPVREVEVGASARVVQAVPLAVAPAPLEVAAEDRRQVAGGAGEVDGEGRARGRGLGHAASIRGRPSQPLAFRPWSTSP